MLKLIIFFGVILFFLGYLASSIVSKYKKAPSSRFRDLLVDSIKRRPFIWLFGLIIIVPFIINYSFVKNGLFDIKWVASDTLSFYGSVLTGITAIIGVMMTFEVQKQRNKPKIVFGHPIFCCLKGSDVQKGELESVGNEINGRCGNSLTHCWGADNKLSNHVDYVSIKGGPLLEFKVKKSTISELNNYAISINVRNNSSHTAKNVYSPLDDVNEGVDLLTNANVIIHVRLSKFQDQETVVHVNYNSESGLDQTKQFKVYNNSDKKYHLFRIELS